MIVVGEELMVKEDVYSPYLSNLEIGNGVLSVPFDSLNNEYTVVIDEGSDELDIYYELEDESASLIIYNNYDLLNYDKEVMVRVVSGDGSDDNTYYLNVVHEQVQSVSDFGNEVVALEIEKEVKDPVYLVGGVAGSCLVLIILVFWLIFKRSSNRIN